MTETEALNLAIETLEEIALAGMSGSGQESKEGLTEWHARQAWKFIGIASRRLTTIRQALAQPEQELFSAPNNFYKDVDEAINKLEKNGSIFDGNDSAPYVVWLLRTLRELATQTQPKNPEPVVWKHDCAALLTNDVELWIDRCPHCGKPRTSPQQPPHPKEPDNEFKNFHRSLCERFGYVHDEKDWKRDLVSLEEWIAKKVQPEHEPVAWQERQAKRMSDGVVTEWTNWYPCRYKTIDEARAEASDHIPYEWRPLYTHPPVPTAQPKECTRSHPHDEMSKECELRTEIARLTNCLARANAQAEHFEREWYLRGDEIERLKTPPQSKEPAQCSDDEAVAWRFTGVAGLRRYMTQKQYDAQTPETKKWYEPYKCVNCNTHSSKEQDVVVNNQGSSDSKGYVFVAIPILEQLGINRAVIDMIAITPPQPKETREK